MTTVAAVLPPALEKSLHWLRAHGTLDDGATLDTILIIIVIFLVAMPRSRPSRKKTPLLMLAVYPLACAMRSLYPQNSALRVFLECVGLFFLLVGLGRIILLTLTVGILERVRKPISKISLDMVMFTIVIGAFLAVLHEAGVETGALFTGSAVLTAVLGFALRDTLGNLFAGLAIQLQRPFEIGDWIQYDLNNFHIGKVTEINWRATKVITLDLAEVILPNGMLGNAYIRNFTKPDPWSRRSVFVIAPYDIPPNRVRQIILEAIPGSFGVLDYPPPSVVTNEFKDRGVEYWVRFFTTEFGTRDRVDGEVRDRIWYALARNGIEIPVATHHVQLTPLPPPPPKPPEEAISERVRRLSSIDLFAVLPEADVRRLALQAQPHLFAEGEIIIRQGDPGQTLFLLEKGEVSVRARTETHASIEVARLGPGSFFGEMSLLTGSPRAATVTAVNECRVLAVNKTALEPIIHDHPQLAEHMSKVLAERRKALADRLASEPEPEPEPLDLFDRIREFFSI